MPKQPFEAGTADLEAVAKALKSEEDGTKQKRALTKALRRAVEPAVTLARSTIMSMDSSRADGNKEGEPLRAAIARQVKAQTRYAGRTAGVRVRVSTKGMPRGFRWAARRTNREKGWRHPVFPKRLEEGVEGPARLEVWVHQTGKPGWFDDSMQTAAPAAATAVKGVVEEQADRIKRGTQ